MGAVARQCPLHAPMGQPPKGGGAPQKKNLFLFLFFIHKKAPSDSSKSSGAYKKKYTAICMRTAVFAVAVFWRPQAKKE